MARLTHRVGLHFRSLSLTKASFDDHLKSAQQTYAQYGIRIDCMSGESLHLSEEQAKKFAKVDGACKWKITTGEYAEVQGLARHGVAWNDIVVYYVGAFSSATLLGCGGHLDGKPACIVAGKASKWDTAHEVGHVLLGPGFTPVHSSDRKNLMHATQATFSPLPVLSPAQVAQIKRSTCCVRI